MQYSEDKQPPNTVALTPQEPSVQFTVHKVDAAKNEDIPEHEDMGVGTQDIDELQGTADDENMQPSPGSTHHF
jgi:hypothetical protein